MHQYGTPTGDVHWQDRSMKMHQYPFWPKYIDGVFFTRQFLCTPSPKTGAQTCQDTVPLHFEGIAVSETTMKWSNFIEGTFVRLRKLPKIPQGIKISSERALADRAIRF